MDKARRFSRKQLAALTWWCPGSPYQNLCAVICDGAVRTGKTVLMTAAFLEWAMHAFSGMSFALCGKTKPSVERNIVEPLLALQSFAI